MPFPAFLSSLIIACSTFIGILFAAITFIEKSSDAKNLIRIIIGSIILLTSTNILIIIAFYQSEPTMDSNYVYPLVTYIFGMIVFVFSGIYILIGKYAKVI
jgi:hypothetical protein